MKDLPTSDVFVTLIQNYPLIFSVIIFIGRLYMKLRLPVVQYWQRSCRTITALGLTLLSRKRAKFDGIGELTSETTL
jgi:hypothetical protein